MAVSGLSISQNPLHDTILEQPYRYDTITDDFFDIETINAIMFEMVNEYRVENGLEPCKIDTTLMRLANNHAEWMATTRIYCHINDERVPNHTDHRKYNFSENCMMYNTIEWNTHYSITEAAVGAWIGSPGHRGNILDSYAIYRSRFISKNDTKRTKRRILRRSTQKISITI